MVFLLLPGQSGHIPKSAHERSNDLHHQSTHLRLGIAMFFGRFLMLIPMLAIAGNLAAKNSIPATAGTFPVTTPLFTALLASVIVIVGALTFFPALALGPVLEHLLLHAGHTF
jgi:K+-transporting ATPase ATPase A chain